MPQTIASHEALARKLSKYLNGGICIQYANPLHTAIDSYGRARGVGVTVHKSGAVHIRASVVASYGTTAAQWRTIRHIEKLCRAAGFEPNVTA